MQRIQCGASSLARLRLDVQGNEISPLPFCSGPRIGQNKRAAPPVDLSDMRSAVLVVAPEDGEAESVRVKPKRPQRPSHVGRAREWHSTLGGSNGTAAIYQITRGQEANRTIEEHDIQPSRERYISSPTLNRRR